MSDIFLQNISMDENSQHRLCDAEWCKFKLVEKEGKVYKHKHLLDKAVYHVIEPIYQDL